MSNVGSRYDLLKIPAQADKLNYQLDILAWRGRANDAWYTSGVQSFQKLPDTRQGLDTGRPDDLPVKFFFQP